MSLSIKFYNTTADRVFQSAVAIADKCFTKNEPFFITSVATDKSLEEVDKMLWTFSSQKFIPHALASDVEYTMYSGDIPNLLSYNTDDVRQFLTKTDAKTLVILNNNPDEDLLTTVINGINIKDCLNLVVAIISKTDEKTQINHSIESCLQLAKSLSIAHEVWQSFDFGWEKVF